MACDLDAIHTGHTYVQQDYIRNLLLAQVQCLSTISCFSNHIPTTYIAHHSIKTGTRQRFVISR